MVAECLSGKPVAKEIEWNKTYNLNEFGILIEDNGYNITLMERMKIDNTYKVSMFEKRWKHGHIWKFNFPRVCSIIHYILWLWGFGSLDMSEIIGIINEGKEV